MGHDHLAVVPAYKLGVSVWPTTVYDRSTIFENSCYV